MKSLYLTAKNSFEKKFLRKEKPSFACSKTQNLGTPEINLKSYLLLLSAVIASTLIRILTIIKA